MYGVITREASSSNSAAFAAAPMPSSLASIASIFFSKMAPKIIGAKAPATLLQIPIILIRFAALSMGPRIVI